MGRLRRTKIKSGSTPTLRDRAAGMIGADAHKKSMTQLLLEHDALLQKRMETLSAMPAASRAAANLILADNNAPLDTPFQTGYADSWSAIEYDDDDGTADPTDISHEGGEIDEVTRAAAEHVLQIPSKQYQRWDVRSRQDRLQAAHAHWEQQMPHLVTAYLEWKHGVNIGRADVEAAECTLFDIVAIKSHSRETLRIPQKCNELANVALLREGLLGCSPVTPAVAISLDTLELYHRLRRHHPQLGIQPIMRALCDIHDVNYTSRLREQFSSAFDVYLDILRRVQCKVDTALGRDTLNWRAKNACHCCDLKLEGEVELRPAKLMALDGNNSAKRMKSAGVEDQRPFISDYILPRKDVDHFKDEVKHRLSRRKVSEDNDHDGEEAEADAPWISEEAPGEAPDGQDNPSPCTERWKASAAEHEKRALDIYETTGIFVSACRHGFIQKACEMVQSGELAKYPLAIVSHLIDIQGSDLGFGYDIGCAFRETVKRSPLVGPKALSQRTQFCVCAFHGYAHNRLCQLHNHPLYLPGFGIEDLEVMERVFSASNAVARGIRYASKFHWAQFIDLHFRQWDDDKYAELSRFLLNNYRQALKIIAENTPEIEALKTELRVSDDDIAQWRNTEREFLESLKEEPEERVLECAYVQALIDRQNADARLEQVRADFHNTSSARPFNYAQDARNTARIEAARRAAMHRLTTAIMAVGDLEAKLDLVEPWTPSHPKYKEVLEYVQHRQFHRALDRVEQLVVQRLGELSKANVSGMGYKLRTSIWKSLKTRAKAIRNAIKQYNTLAASMKPPAPLLEWKDIVNYTFLSEFELLRNSYSRRDILAEKWTNPRNRSIMAKYFKAVGARDELTRLNCEVRRLRTGIAVENEEFEQAVKQTLSVDTLLAAELRVQYQRRTRVNSTHLIRLRTIETLPGYTGTFGSGIPVERGRDLMMAQEARTMCTTDLSTLPVVDSETDVVVEDAVFEDERCNNEILRFSEFLEGFGAMTLDG